MNPSKRTTKRPGIAKRTKPQRDTLGRFIPKVGTSDLKLGTCDIPSRSEEFESIFRESPHWLKRVRESIGIFVMRWGFKLANLGLYVHGR